VAQKKTTTFYFVFILICLDFFLHLRFYTQYHSKEVLMKNNSLKLAFILIMAMIFALSLILIINHRATAASAVAYGCRGAYGFSYNYTSEEDAKQRAMQECSKYCDSCRIILTTGSTGWGAIARNEQTGRVGCSAAYSTRFDAEQRALKECGYGCIIKTVWNDTVSGQ